MGLVFKLVKQTPTTSSVSASYADSSSYAVTASYAENGGVTRLIAGPNITLSPSGGVGEVIISASAAGRPGGENFQAQYNNSNTFDGIPTLTYSGSVLRATGLFFGDLTGTASYSSNSLTASYALNGGVTQIIAGANISISPTNGLGQVTITSTATGGSSGSNATSSFSNSSTWTFLHGLNTLYPVIQVYDSGYNQVIPQNIFSSDPNTTIITFPTPESGYAIASVGGVGSTATSASYAFNATSASYTQTASYILNAVSASFASTASLARNAQTASYVLNAISSSFASTASYVLNAVSASFANNSTSASYALNAGNTSTIDINVFGSNVDSYLLMSNVVATPGVAIGGDADLRYNSSTNKLTVGSISAISLTGSLQGTSSWSNNAITASYVLNAISASFSNTSQTANTASYVLNAVSASFASTANISNTASYVLNAVSASFASTANISNTASYVLNAVSASFASTASLAPNYVLTSVTSSMLSPYVLTSVTSSMTVATASFVTSSRVFGPNGANSILSSSFALTASSVNTLNQNVLITGSLTVSSTTVGSTENTLTLGPAPGGGTGEGGQLGLQAAGGIYTSASFIDTWQDQFRILRGSNAGSNAGLMYMNLQSGNTQFVGAVTASAYSGLPNSWLHTLRSGNQTISSGTWANRDIIFNDVSSNNFTYNSSTGIATLRAGKTYRLTARLAWSAAGLYTLKFRIYNQTTSAFTGPTVEMIQSPNGTFNVSDNTLEHILAVGASDIDISIRTTSDTNALSGEFIRGDLNTQLIIQQIS